MLGNLVLEDGKKGRLIGAMDVRGKVDRKQSSVIDLFTVPIVFCFPKCHRVGVIQHVAFLDWLLSLSDVHLRLLYVFLGIDSSCVISAE